MPLNIHRIMGETGQTAMVTLVEAEKAVGPPGAKMAVFENRRCLGTIGRGAAESMVREAALQAIAVDRPRMQKLSLDAGRAAAEGMVCGRDLEIFIEPVSILDNKLLKELNTGA
ncbi:MAG: XdhC family protein [Firmicutes bacterium]|nr:XdhC family protein [Bacillota bacterium]